MQNSNEEDLKLMLRMQTTETTQQPQMSDLPSYWVSVKALDFQETGVDFFGPF